MYRNLQDEPVAIPPREPRAGTNIVRARLNLEMAVTSDLHSIQVKDVQLTTPAPAESQSGRSGTSTSSLGRNEKTLLGGGNGLTDAERHRLLCSSNPHVFDEASLEELLLMLPQGTRETAARCDNNVSLRQTIATRVEHLDPRKIACATSTLGVADAGGRSGGSGHFPAPRHRPRPKSASAAVGAGRGRGNRYGRKQGQQGQRAVATAAEGAAAATSGLELQWESAKQIRGPSTTKAAGKPQSPSSGRLRVVAVPSSTGGGDGGGVAGGGRGKGKGSAQGQGQGRRQRPKSANAAVRSGSGSGCGRRRG